MERNYLSNSRLAGLVLIFSTFVTNIAAQPAAEPAEGNGWVYAMVVIILVGFACAVYFWRKSKKGDPQYNYDNRYSDYYKNESYDMEGVDAEKELEWLRKAKQTTSKAGGISYGMKKPASSSAKPSTARKVGEPEELNFDTKIFQEKMRKLQYNQLPINSFGKLTPSKLYNPLLNSNDPALLSAIEQANEEFEEDEAVRNLAVRILTAFRTRNSIEALSQIALYDLSSNLRSKAVASLTEFDHDSVFEAILLACADPTREVRAAAARGLFRLSFDRADAWKRIIETNDEYRMSHAARAAIEAGIVVKSFDRLVHEDLKVAYEAFTLVALLIRSGETAEIFNAIASHKDERVRLALLHVLRVQGDERTQTRLLELQKGESLPAEVAERVRETIASFEPVPA